MNLTIVLLGIVWVIYWSVLLPLYIVKVKQKGSIEALGYKMILSTIFCTIGLFGVIRQKADIFSLLIFAGMLFAIVGDYFLAYIKTDEKKFIIGILSFGITHILYIAAMITSEGLHIQEFLITAIVIAISYVISNKMKMEMGKAKWLLSGYSILVTFMAVKAVLMMNGNSQNPTLQLIFSIGAVMFLISDILLCVWKFYNDKQLLSNLVSALYFTGQLLIATAIFF
ncbi:MAG: lysoplasmalogenase [Mobilitalea sp.]